MARGKTRPDNDALVPMAVPLSRADRWIALGLALAFLGLYLRTLCPTVFWYDSAEFAAVAATLGITHPPGYPLYTLLGHIFTRLLPVEPALAVNAMSASFGAVALALTYLLGRRLGARPAGAVFGTTVLGTSTLYWSQSLVAEVYTPGLTALLLVLWLLLLARDTGRDGPAVAAAACAGLGLGLHYFLATCGLGLVLLSWGGSDINNEPGSWRSLLSVTGPRLRRSALSLLALAVGLLVFAYLPLRSSQHPLIDLNQPSSWRSFAWMVTGGGYGPRFGQLGWGVALARLAGLLYDQLLVVGLLLAALGAWALGRRGATTLVALLAMVLGNAATFLRYDVQDPEVFFMPTLALLALLTGLGADALVALVNKIVGANRRLIPSLLTAALFLFPAAQLVVGWSKVDLHDYRAAQHYGERVCRELPRGALIVNYTKPPEWKNHAVFLYYQAALGRRRDVTVLVAPTLDEVKRRVDKGERLYTYVPWDNLAAHFSVRKEGLLYRVGPRR